MFPILDGRKSMSEERTFGATDNLDLLLSQLESNCVSLMESVLREYKGCHNVGIIVKYDDFERITRTKKSEVTVSDTPLLIKLTKELFIKHWDRSRKVNKTYSINKQFIL